MLMTAMPGDADAHDGDAWNDDDNENDEDETPTHFSSQEWPTASAVSRTTQRASRCIAPPRRASDEAATTVQSARLQTGTVRQFDCPSTLFLRHGTRWCRYSDESSMMSVSHSDECARVPLRVALARVAQLAA